MSRSKLLVLVPWLASLIMTASAHATSSSLVISQIQTGSATNAGQEFVELYNPTASDVVVDGWQLQYKSATSAVADSSWSKRADLTGTVKSYGYYLISQSTYLPAADVALSTAGLAGTGGHVRIRDGSGNVIDTVGWGSSANAAETAPAPAPAAGQSIERLPGRLIVGAGNATDTDDNSKDFIIDATPAPRSTISPLADPTLVTAAPTDPGSGGTTQPDPTTVPVDPDQPAAAPVTYAPIMITELFPDPAQPLTDAHDEFIELYNPTSDPVDVGGYTLQTGSAFHAFYILPQTTIAPGGYLAVYSGDSHINLPNSGGQARLLDPTGAVVSLTADYGSAKTGESWSLIDSNWEWSLQLTPNAANVYVEPILDLPLSSSAKTTAAKTTSKAKTTTTKASTTKVAAKSTKKTTAPKTTSTPVALVATTTNHSGAWLLIALAVLSIGYAIYEFRHDVRNYYHIARRYLKTR